MMPTYRPAVLLLGCLALASCATVREPERKVLATATLLSADGSISGNAIIAAERGNLELVVEAANLSAGEHGAHLHMIGSCVPRDFSSAGGHLNPFSRMHGRLNPQGSHAGDLPNISIGADGKGELRVGLPGTREELEPLLFDADGTAIVIHAGPDDYRTDPSGNSGGRIACGVFAVVR